jgi:hypothetical protein
MSTAQLLAQREYRRLERGATEDEVPGGLGTVRFIAFCPGDSPDVLERAKCVLTTVNKRSRGGWPSDDGWKTLLPGWFIEQCAPEQSHEEAERWLKWWKRLPPDEQQHVEAHRKWSFGNWIYWFRPENRVWFWWDGAAPCSDRLVIAVEVSAWPFPWGSLSWLLRASGAQRVEPEQDGGN